jgi:hypothetical protein
MMKALSILGVAALALACGSASGNDRPEASEASLKPGEWELKTEVVSIAADGMPSEIVERMKTQDVGASSICITPGETGERIAERFAGNSSPICKNEGFVWSRGRMRGKRTCTAAGGAWTSATMDGSFGPRTMDVRMTSEARGGDKWLKMERRTTGRRVGECTRRTGSIEK